MQAGLFLPRLPLGARPLVWPSAPPDCRAPGNQTPRVGNAIHFHLWPSPWPWEASEVNSSCVSSAFSLGPVDLIPPASCRCTPAGAAPVSPCHRVLMNRLSVFSFMAWTARQRPAVLVKLNVLGSAESHVAPKCTAHNAKGIQPQLARSRKLHSEQHNCCRSRPHHTHIEANGTISCHYSILFLSLCLFFF